MKLFRLLVFLLLVPASVFAQDQPPFGKHKEVTQKPDPVKITMAIDSLRYIAGKGNTYMSKDWSSMASISAIYVSSYEDAKSRQYAQHTAQMKNGRSEEKQEGGKTYLYESGDQGMHRFEFYIVKDGEAAIEVIGLSRPDTPGFAEDLKKAALSARKAAQ